MTVAVERLAAGPTLVRVDGPLDYPATEELDAALRSVLHAGATGIAVDLTRAAPLDDAAVGVLYEALRGARAKGGTVVLAVTDEPLRQVLTVMGLDRAFRIADSVEAALTAV